MVHHSDREYVQHLVKSLETFLHGETYSYFNRDVLKNRLPLPPNECRYIFGCSLESKLASGQCFIRYQVLDEDGQPKEKPEFRTVVGPVVVTKNPW